jgi:hypothetical protein
MARSELPQIPEYGIWQAMKRRCDSPTNKSYPRYGGRGIKVCDRWVRSFWAFYADMGPRPSADHQLDREDNDGNYEPDNCHWRTRNEQCRNRSTNHLELFRGEMRSLAEIAEMTGINQQTIWYRVESGLSGEELAEPVVTLYTVNGESHTLMGWSNKLGIGYHSLRARLDNGWTAERTFTTPLRSKRTQTNECTCTD